MQEEDLSGADVKVMTLSDWSMEDAAQYVKEKVKALVPRWMWKDLNKLGKILMDATNDDFMM